MAENSLVVKSNKLIEARYNLNLNEQKLFLYSVSKLDKELKEFKSIIISITEFVDLIDIQGDHYKYVRDIARSLRSKEVFVKIGDKEVSMGWFSKIKADKQTQDIEVYFDDDLVPYLLQLKNRFTRYQLKNILHLKNKYSIRIYELLKQYENIGQREFPVDEIREFLAIGDKYKEFKEFNKFVLNKTKKEINEHTDLDIDYITVKRGRKVVAIKYKIERKLSDMEKLTTMYDIKDIREKCGLQKEKWSDSQVLELYSIATEKAEDVNAYYYVKLNYLKMVQDGKARNKFAYLKKGLEDDYAGAYVQLKYDYIVTVEE